MRSLLNDRILLLAAAAGILGVIVSVATDHLGTAVIFVALLQGVIVALILLVLRGQRLLRAAADRRATTQKEQVDAWLTGVDRTLTNIGELVVTEAHAAVRELRDPPRA